MVNASMLSSYPERASLSWSELTYLLILQLGDLPRDPFFLAEAQ